MYCKHCGKEIADDSKFCQHCGKSQDNYSWSLTNKPVWIIYVIWAVANLYLLMGDKHNRASAYIFPFTQYNDSWGGHYEFWEKRFYDFSEFIVYVFVVPAILYLLYKFLYMICKR